MAAKILYVSMDKIKQFEYLDVLLLTRDICRIVSACHIVLGDSVADVVVCSSLTDLTQSGARVSAPPPPRALQHKV